VAISPLSSTTAVVATLSAISRGIVRCGSGVTLTTVSARGSAIDVQSNITTLTLQDGAAAICRRTMTVGTFNLYGGSAIYNSSGTITTLALGSAASTGSIDLSQDTRAVTITNKVTATRGSGFNDPGGRATLSGGFQVTKGRITDVTFVAGLDKTYSLS